MQDACSYAQQNMSQHNFGSFGRLHSSQLGIEGEKFAILLC